MTKQIKSYDDNTFRKNLVFSGDPDLDTARKLAYRMCGQVFENIDMFPYCYFMNGVTEAIDFVVSRHRAQVHENEYRYLFSHPTVSREEQELAFRSYPFSHDGKFGDIPDNKSVMLDCSYMFASNLKCNPLIPANVKLIAFGLSKSHNLADVRTGWLFSRTRIMNLHLVQYDHNYASSIHKMALAAALSAPPNHLYLKYQKSFSALYKEHGLLEGDTNLFALAPDGKRVPWYTLVKDQS